MDYQLGRVLDTLDALQLTDDTIVLLHGDHGWQLGEHNSWHKFTNFELGVRTSRAITRPLHMGGGRAPHRTLHTREVVAVFLLF